jgi:hypothetical protein
VGALRAPLFQTLGLRVHYSKTLLRYFTLAALAFSFFSIAMAQSDQQKAQNLATCLVGRYPTLCKQGWLSADERQKVEQAERRENLQTCLTGRYPSLCNKRRLSTEDGKQVADAERAENLRTCSTGRYPSLCNRSLLTSEQLTLVQTAEARARLSPTTTATPFRGAGSRRGRSSGCDDGHWVDSVSSDGTIVKLEDGSIWEVDLIDAIDSALWLPTTDIIACDDKLINTDENEKVSARRIR